MNSFTWVTIHNAGGSSHFFDLMNPALKNFAPLYSYTLCAHNQKASCENLSIESMAQNLSEELNSLSNQPFVLIGLNYGALVAIELALKNSHDLKALILLDPPLCMSEALIEEIKKLMEQLENEDHQKVAQELIQAFLKGKPEPIQKIVYNSLMSLNPEDHYQVYEGLLKWDKHSKGKLAKVLCPTLGILTDEKPCSYETLHRELPAGSQIGKCVYSNAWSPLVTPEQVTSMILDFVSPLT